MKAFGYSRVSGASQVEGDGPERQNVAIRAYAESHGLEIEQIFLEGGVSGKTEWGDRPAWVEMLRAIAENGVRTIVIERLDRLSRRLMVQEHIIDDLRARRIPLISVAEPDLCTDDPDRVMMRQIVGAIAEYNRATIVVKMRSAKVRMKARGERTDGAFPYGSHPQKPEEKATLEWMIGLQRSGQTITEIAMELNRSEIPSRRGRCWHPAAVGRILRRQPVPLAA